MKAQNIHKKSDTVVGVVTEIWTEHFWSQIA